MSIKRRLGECLDIDLEKEVWCCNRCGFELISARENFKKGCLIYARDPRTINRPLADEYACYTLWLRSGVKKAYSSAKKLAIAAR